MRWSGDIEGVGASKFETERHEAGGEGRRGSGRSHAEVSVHGPVIL